MTLRVLDHLHNLNDANTGRVTLRGSNLDSANAEKLHELFFKLRDDFGQTFVIVTHNRELANMADRTLTMADGRMLG